MASNDAHGLTEDELRVLETLLAKFAGVGGDLPWPLFRFVTEVAATANVDLLVRDPDLGVLLSWRDDPFGSGWHVPGSVIRHREEIAHRIATCAADEFGCEVEADERPVALIQIFDDRGHSISICFPATVRGAPGKRILGENDVAEPGDLRWFRAPPSNLYPSHMVYESLLGALARGELGTGIQVFTQHVGRRDAAQTTAEGVIAPDVPLA
jgi:ADP-ribose pyrophosphatase YjhB (NUDIX family)